MWTQGVRVRKVTETAAKKQEDNLILEQETALYLNGESWGTVAHTPQLVKEYAVGYMAAKGLLIDSSADITYETGTVHIKTKEDPKSIVSSPHLSFMRPNPHQIFTITAYFQQESVLYKKTAVTESAAIGSLSQLELLSFAEDMTQENALYKALGSFIISNNKVPHGLCVLLSSTITKSQINVLQRVGVATIVSRTAPTKQALDIATRFNITVLGFARGRRFNWYTA